MFRCISACWILRALLLAPHSPDFESSHWAIPDPLPRPFGRPEVPWDPNWASRVPGSLLVSIERWCNRCAWAHFLSEPSWSAVPTWCIEPRRWYRFPPIPGPCKVQREGLDCPCDPTQCVQPKGQYPERSKLRWRWHRYFCQCWHSTCPPTISSRWRDASIVLILHYIQSLDVDVDYGLNVFLSIYLV